MKDLITTYLFESNLSTSKAIGVLLLLLIAGCTNSGYKLQPESKVISKYSFAIMSDPHIQSANALLPKFLRAIKEVNLLPVDFTVICGDLIEGGGDADVVNNMWDAFDAATTTFKSPFYQVIGNHDVTSTMTENLYLQRYGKRFQLYYSFNHKGSHIIVLDSEKVGENQLIKDKQFEWLKQDLHHNKNSENIFVFLHNPLWEVEGSNWNTEVHPLLAKYGVDTVFSGHWHRYYKSNNRDGIRYIKTGSLSVVYEPELYGEGNFYNYLVVTVHGKESKISVIRPGYIEDEEIASDNVHIKKESLLSELQPINLRVEQDSRKLPTHFDIIIRNPFDLPITGALTWQIPEDSPWNVAESNVAINVKPQGQQKVTINTPLGANVTDSRTFEPFPKADWDLKVAGKSLFADTQTYVTFDYWPYASNRKKVENSFDTRFFKPVITSTGMETNLLLKFNNPLEWKVQEILSWQFPKSCYWKILPASAKVQLEPHETKRLEFKVSFTGLHKNVYPLPRLDRLVMSENIEMTRKSYRLPILLSPETEQALRDKSHVVSCIYTENIIVDGKLDDQEWELCQVASDLTVLGGRQGWADYQTEGRFAYDNENFYASFRCYDPDISQITTNVKNRDGAVWGDDCVEFYLDTNLDRRTYYFASMNANAIVFDSKPGIGQWDGITDIKTGHEEKAWILEFAIPWKMLDINKPKHNTTMGMNFCRHRPIVRKQGGESWSQWSPTFTGNHAPDRFGHLKFD